MPQEQMNQELNQVKKSKSKNILIVLLAVVVVLIFLLTFKYISSKLLIGIGLSLTLIIAAYAYLIRGKDIDINEKIKLCNEAYLKGGWGGFGSEFNLDPRIHNWRITNWPRGSKFDILECMLPDKIISFELNKDIKKVTGVDITPIFDIKNDLLRDSLTAKIEGKDIIEKSKDNLLRDIGIT